VVAGEVKNLANQTAKATVDIRQLIESLRSEISSIVATMETSAAAVEEGEKVISETGDQITVIAQRADSITNRMQEIADSLGQQQSAADEIAQGVGMIARMSTHNNNDIHNLLNNLDRTFDMLTAQLKGYEDCSGDQAILAFGRSDHAAFKKRILDGVLSRKSLHSHDVADHRNCRLGKWYLQAKDGSVGKLPSFYRLDGPHAEVHDHGKRALDLKDKGDMDGALREILAMDKASVQVLEILNALFNEAG